VTVRLTLAELADCGAHQTGHFRLSSGLHSSHYLQCALYLADPRRAGRAGELLASTIDGTVDHPDLIVSPALGGVIIGHETARALAVPFLFAERTDGAMALRRGFALAPGQRVVVVEDVVTTGGSSREVVALAEAGGAEVLAVASLVNRAGPDNPFHPLPFQSLLDVSFPVWRPEECPLCRDGVSIQKPGSRPIT